MADTAKVTINAPAPIFQAWATSIPVKLRADAIQAVTDWSPEKAEPIRLSVAKNAAIELIQSQPDDVKAVEVKFESNSGSAPQIMVLVIPHNL